MAVLLSGRCAFPDAQESSSVIDRVEPYRYQSPSCDAIGTITAKERKPRLF